MKKQMISHHQLISPLGAQGRRSLLVGAHSWSTNESDADGESINMYVRRRSFFGLKDLEYTKPTMRAGSDLLRKRQEHCALADDETEARSKICTGTVRRATSGPGRSSCPMRCSALRRRVRRSRINVSLAAAVFFSKARLADLTRCLGDADEEL